MAKLAINGGKKVVQDAFPLWPVYDEREEKALLEVLRSRIWGTLGPKVEEFQKKFCDYVGTKFSVGVCNGTVSLETIMRALDIGLGDEVIVPPYTFIATASAVLMVNATPVFADIDPDTNCIDTASMGKAITSKTKAIIPVHIAGCSADMDEILRIAGKYNLAVIEDAAHAHGSEWKGKKLGSLGTAGSFSFQLSKNMAGGEGGIITTNDEQVAEACWSIHHIGRSRTGAFYDHFRLASNYRLAEWQAAVLCVQLERLDEQIEKREAASGYLDAQLSQIPGIRAFKRDDRVTRHSHNLYMIKYLEEEFKGVSREKFIAALNAEGIPASAGYKPLNKQSVFESSSVKKLLSRDMEYSQMYLPGLEKACTQTVTMSQNILLGTEAQVKSVVDAVIKVRENIEELL